MKHKLPCFILGIIFLFITNIPFSFAQWETHGPYGGPGFALQKAGGNIYLGNSNGVITSTDNGLNWSGATSVIERQTCVALTAYGSKLFAAIYGNGIYESTVNNGNIWTQKNNGLTNFFFTSLFSVDSQLYAGTANGVYYSPDNGNSWSLQTIGIPTTYSAYSFSNMGDTVFAGTYGMGLYRTNDKGVLWTNVSGGIPVDAFVYALISDGDKMYAGTNSGVYKSIDRGNNWTPSNNGFPASMWASCFAIEPGYIFAGTYSEGIFVSTDNGNTWTQKNSGIPDLPFPTGLPHNYPAVEAIVASGSNVIAATVNGIYLTLNNGNTWLESNHGILAEDIRAIGINGSAIFAGTARNGVFSSTDGGASWARSNNGLTYFDMVSITTKGSSVFVSAVNEKVFRSDNNGATWIHADSGITSDPTILKSDNLRVLAVTGGAKYIPRALFQTTDNGAYWTEIPTGFTGDISALESITSAIYAGTFDGKLFYTTDLGINWQDISGTLPTAVINTVLISGTKLYVGTEGQGIFMSPDNGVNWVQVNTGITNNYINDIEENNGSLYAATWGGGVFVSADMGSSWWDFNNALADKFVRNLTSTPTKLYAGTDIGVYSTTTTTGIIKINAESKIILFPNPSSGIVFFSTSSNQKAILTVYNIAGEEVYHYEGYPKKNESIDLSGYSKGIYFLRLKTEKEIIQNKIVIQ